MKRFITIRRGWASEFSLRCTSVGVDATSGNVAVRVLCNPVAGAPGSAVVLGSGGCSTNALWTDAECPSDRGQRGNDASGWDAIDNPSREFDVARCQREHAATILGRPSAALNVQCRRSRHALRGYSHRCDLPATNPQNRACRSRMLPLKNWGLDLLVKHEPW
jgi:hypothetical protein